MALSIEDLITPLTRQQVQASVYNVLSALGTNVTQWRSGSVVRTMIVGTSLVMSAFSELMADIARSGFLALSAGDWLTLVARNVYGVERQTATFASGVVRFQNAGGGVYILDPGDLIIANVDTGYTYRNISAVTILALAVDQDVDMVAVEAGSASNSSPNTLTQVVSALPGVTCTNITGITGLDDQTDAALRSECSERLGALSPFGPWDAYTYALKNAVRDDGTPIGVTRIKLIADGFGHVDLYCATASGPVVPGDLDALDEAVQTKAAPQAITARVFAADAVTIHVEYEVWLYNTSGYTVAEIETMIGVAITDFIAAQPIGGNVIDPLVDGKVYVDALRSAIARALPEIFHVVVTDPPADVSLAPSEVPTTDAPTVIAIHQVPPPEGYRPA